MSSSSEIQWKGSRSQSRGRSWVFPLPFWAKALLVLGAIGLFVLALFANGVATRRNSDLAMLNSYGALLSTFIDANDDRFPPDMSHVALREATDRQGLFVLNDGGPVTGNSELESQPIASVADLKRTISLYSSARRDSPKYERLVYTVDGNVHWLDEKTFQAARKNRLTLP